MFGIGSSELLVILVLALIVIGPKSLPQIARTLGKAMGEFRKVSTDFQRTLNTEIAFEEDTAKRKAHHAEAEKALAEKKAAEAAGLNQPKMEAVNAEATATTVITQTAQAEPSPTSGEKA